jgi:hypothetical protein
MSAPTAHLIALDPDVRPAEYLLQPSGCAIGRAPRCEIVIDRPSISRVHARVAFDGARHVLIDAGSRNGTFVNGVALEGPHPLDDADVIGLSSATGLLRFVDPDRTVVPAGRLRFDQRQMLFSLDNQVLELTPTQFRLLHYLYQHGGQLCGREGCATAIWGPDYAPGLDADALDKAISGLRGKLRQISASANLISTRAGLGYVLHVLPPESVS